MRLLALLIAVIDLGAYVFAGGGQIFGGGATAAGAAGSVQFSNGSGLSSDDSNFFWSSSNHCLAVGTNSCAGTYGISAASGVDIGSSAFLVIEAANTPHVIFQSSTYFGMLGADGNHNWTFGYGSSPGTLIGKNMSFGDDGLSYPYPRSTAQIAALTPLAAGGLIFNSTITSVCISTGTTLGGFAKGSGATNTTACS